MQRILLIDGDLGTVGVFEAALRDAAYAFNHAETGLGGLRSAQEVNPELAVVAIHLPDCCGLEVIRQLRSWRPNLRCVLLIPQRDYRTEFTAIDLGARGCVVKPVMVDDVREMVTLALPPYHGPAFRSHARRQRDAGAIYPHSLARLAERVVAFVDAGSDGATLREFGREVGVSVGGFRNWCHTAGLKANSVVRFARGLRATLRQAPDVDASNLLKIIDKRTLQSFLSMCGGGERELPNNLDEFLMRQQFIGNLAFVNAVRVALDAQTVSHDNVSVIVDAAGRSCVRPTGRT